MASEQYSALPVTRLEWGTADTALLRLVRERRLNRVLLMTGNKSFSWFQSRGLLGQLSEIASLEVWASTRPNPDVTQLNEALGAARNFRPDVVIGIGGGSVLDIAKLTANLWEGPKLAEDVIFDQLLHYPRKTQLLLFPTTAGSGAEATHFSVLYRGEIKHSVAGPGLIADYVGLDPNLPAGAPPPQRASSALDALCQCIESIWANSATERSVKLATAGLKLASKHLIPFALGDVRSSSGMQWSSHLSGQAINISRTTGPHALSYYLSTTKSVPHGIAVASTIGYFLDHHNQLLRDGKVANFVRLSDAMSVVNKQLELSGDRSGSSYFGELFSKLGLGRPEDYWPGSSSERMEWQNSANQARMANHPTPFPIF